MRQFRILLIVAGFVMLALVLAQPVKATISTQQAQIGFTIVVNVTPSPVAYVPRASLGGSNQGIVASTSLQRISPSLARGFRAESLQFEGGSTLVAQVQHSVLVQAEVTPNPKGAILYTDVGGNPGSSVTVNAVAGTTQQYPCAFTVTVGMTTTWVLDEGLSNDFASGWSGKDLANDTYISAATPKPTSTPYVVYADDGSVWSQMATGTAMTTYCVTLTLTVPGTTDSGTYSTNAVYTLFN